MKLPIGKCVFFFTMIETLSSQSDIGSDNSEALNLAKWGDFLLYEILPDKMTYIDPKAIYF